MRDGLELDIGRWLEGLGLGQYAAAFHANAVDAATLPHLAAGCSMRWRVSGPSRRRRLQNPPANGAG
jgi:hypothetical protein